MSTGYILFWHDLDFIELYLGQGESTVEYRKYEGSRYKYLLTNLAK